MDMTGLTKQDEYKHDEEHEHGIDKEFRCRFSNDGSARDKHIDNVAEEYSHQPQSLEHLHWSERVTRRDSSFSVISHLNDTLHTGSCLRVGEFESSYR